MRLFIRIKDGKPFEHPIFEDNFCQAFPNIDVNNLPPEFAIFERVAPPLLGPYEKNQRVQYECDENGVYRDVWYCDQMTEEEIAKKQQQVKDEWAKIGFQSWIFDETQCKFVPPIPYPNDLTNHYLIYIWDEPTTSWKLME